MPTTQTMRELLDGSTAIVRGALRAGCDFFAGYPTAPAASVLVQMMHAVRAAGGVAVQAEDEIASISMCIGAVLAGARALTATSGPGLSLYGESVGLAVMGEVPLVIVDVQRLGPATGGATTVGQGDIQLARWGTSGGYPIIALAPSSVPECYTLTMKAFDLAERFRCPVFVLADKELALMLHTVDPSELRDVPVRRREPWPPAVGAASPRPYRYEPPDGVPPLPRFGSEAVVRFTGSSHDERGLPSREPGTVGALNRHLSAKIERHADEIALVASDPQPGARTLLVSYGITASAMREAVARARRRGQRVAALAIQSLWPVPELEIARAAADVDCVVVGELNLGEYRREVERIVGGRAAVVGIDRVDGELISPAQFLEEVY